MGTLRDWTGWFLVPHFRKPPFGVQNYWEIGWDRRQKNPGEKPARIPLEKIRLDPCVDGIPGKLHPAKCLNISRFTFRSAVYLENLMVALVFSPREDLSKDEHSQLLKTISNLVSGHARVTCCHKTNCKMIKLCMDRCAGPTFLISHQLCCWPTWEQRNSWAVGSTSLCHRWKNGR